MRFRISFCIAVLLSGFMASAGAQSTLQSLESQITSIVGQIEPAIVIVRDSRGGVASGMVYREDGHILTTALLAPEGGATVHLSDGLVRDAELVGKDALSGIAVLKIDADGLPTAKLGDSDAVEKGSWVLVIGNSYGMSNSISTGVVSGPSRQIDGREMLQITAPINPGMSGAPVISSEGKVIGLVASTFRRGPSAERSGLIQRLQQLESQLGKLQLQDAIPHAIASLQRRIEALDMQRLQLELQDIDVTDEVKRVQEQVAALDMQRLQAEISQPDATEIRERVQKELMRAQDRLEVARHKAEEKHQRMLHHLQKVFEEQHAQLRDTEKALSEKFQQRQEAMKRLSEEGVFHQPSEAVNPEGMSFAIPISDIRYAADQLIQSGKVERGWAGIILSGAQSSGSPGGVLVQGLTSSSPAREAGLKSDDLIVRCGAQRDSLSKVDVIGLQRAIRQSLPGTMFFVEVQRGDESLVLPIKLGNRTQE